MDPIFFLDPYFIYLQCFSLGPSVAISFILDLVLAHLGCEVSLLII